MGKRQPLERNSGQQSAAALAGRWHSLAIHLLRRVRTRDASSGLSPARLSALSVVVYAGPLNLRRLAQAEGVTPPTMSRIVAALEDARLVRRNSNTDDRREIVLSATARGRRRLEAARRERLELLAGLFAAASHPEAALLDSAAGVLERLIGGRR